MYPPAATPAAVTFSLAETETDLADILRLQAANLPQHLTAEKQTIDGFVTVHHSSELLRQMNHEAAAIIARCEGELAGYCLAMPESFRHTIPVLIPMFEEMDKLRFEGEKLTGNYIVSGQVCVGERFRGQGIFDKLYAFYQDTYKTNYKYLLTEISQRNQRSLKAHKRIGFQTIKQYQAPDGEAWDIVIWNWRT